MENNSNSLWLHVAKSIGSLKRQLKPRPIPLVINIRISVLSLSIKALKCCLVRLVNRLIFGLDGCKAYIDDAIIFSEEWELEIIREFFERLSDANLLINLPKCEFCHANLTFLGHIIG